MRDHRELQLHLVRRVRVPDVTDVEGEFLCSWDWIQEFYSADLKDWTFSGAMLRLLTELRLAGYDRRLRAGQSMYTLVLSRSRRHGLRAEQPFLAVVIHEKGVTVHFGEERREMPRASLSPELKEFLDRLAAEPIS